MRTYRASALGSCTRAQIALQLGHAALGTSDRMQALYDRGNAHEEECLAAMEGQWVRLEPGTLPTTTEDQGQHYIELEVAGAQITGHLDGILYSIDDRHRVLEIKSPISFAKWERAHKTGDYSDPLMHRYAWQISVYMVATGLEAVVACCEDGQVRTFGIEVSPFRRSDIEARVHFMEQYVSEGKVPDACSQADYPCPVAYLHDRPEVAEDGILDDLLGMYADNKAIRDEADAQMKFTREQIDAHLGILDTLTTEAGTATRVPPSTPMSWKETVEAAEAAGLDLKPYYKRGKRAGYINVTPKESP